MSEDKRLTRSKKNRLLAGVCGGVAEYFGWDPSIVRIIWVVLSLFPTFPGIIAYIVAWILMPEETDGMKPSDDSFRGE